LDRLSAFNDEEWADKPYLIELRGGPRSGKRFSWHTLPMAWHEPIPLDFNAIFLSQSVALSQTSTSQMQIADYRETGSVTDDGVHVYEFSRFE
jgi:hypothetical protein